MKKSIAANRSGGLVLALAGSFFSMQAGAIPLAPAMAGQFLAGTGVDAQFLKVPDSWQQSTVLWNETTSQFGSGVPVSTFAWGTGLWGLADWQTTQVTPGMHEASWSGRVAEISFGDEVYNNLYGATWGTVALAPLFTQAGAPASQDNWTSRFGGYIRITEAGSYNFSVLHDDGFFFQPGRCRRPEPGTGQRLPEPARQPGLRQQPGTRRRPVLRSSWALTTGLRPVSWNCRGRATAACSRACPARTSWPWAMSRRCPEPGTWAMLLTGLLALAATASRRRKSRR